MKPFWRVVFASLIVTMVGALLIAACGPIAQEPVPYPMYKVYRFVDKEAGVVCWVLRTGGIDCLPLDETKLK